MAEALLLLSKLRPSQKSMSFENKCYHKYSEEGMRAIKSKVSNVTKLSKIKPSKEIRQQPYKIATLPPAQSDNLFAKKGIR
ncbi:hypothetical protein L484_005997 [Morus notabilis]|uniref:Uncharacterized protein n=1 Tax=Morus notabilis TaxID=981085 RepID=W9R4B3_9ROSA|nr:hypothetical protein L484_005997 [Morus notabilis]